MSADFVAWCQELLAPLGRIRARRMFGGHGLYADEVFVAIIAGEQLYLKVDESSRAEFVAAGCHPFEYQTAQGGRGVMSYYSAPTEAMDAPGAMLPWARLALAAALRARAAAPPASRRPAGKTRRHPTR